MTTTITTIREPKTFQQIQDQQNELGKQSALESLNDNISKLIKAINDKDAKRETEQDRQLKTNQLELSKLQLRRAQLGLAKDEKYYQDYSKKWNKNHNVGTKLGFDHSTSTSLGATGLSLLSGGLINPVILKEVIFPLVTPLKNITKVLASFPGLVPMLFNRVGGKSSSAIKSDKDRILHGKLDQILGAIKDKTKSSKVKEEKEQSLLSKFLNMLLLGAVGLTALNTFVGGNMGIIGTTFEEHGKAMLAGFVFGGWRGALICLALDLFAKETGIIPKKTDKPTIIDVTAANAVGLIKEVLGNDFPLNEAQFKLAMAGLMFGGPKGMLAGYLLGNETVKNAINSFTTNGLSGLQQLAEDQINKLKEGTILEKVPAKAIEGAIFGASLGLKGGPKGFLAGALLGAAGGFVWDRYVNANLPEEHGFQSQFNPATFDWELANLGKTWSAFDREARDILEQEKRDGKRENYTEEERLAYTKQLIERAYAEKGVSREGKSFWESTGDYVKENPVETLATAGGIALLTSTTATKLLSGTIRSLGKTARGLIQTSGAGSQLASLVTGLVLLWVAKGLYNANGEIDKEYNEELFKEENKGKQASEILNEIRNRAIENGEISKVIMASVQGLGAGIAEFFHPDKEKLLEIKRTTLKYNRDFHQSGQKYIFGQDEFERYKESAVDYLGSLIGNDDLLAKIDREGAFTGNKIWIDERFLPLLESIGFNPKDIQKYNEIENKNPKEVTKEEKLFQENLLDKIGKVSKDDKGVFIINSQNEEKIDKEEKKSKEEEYQCMRDNTEAMKKNTEIQREWLQRIKDAENGSYSDLQTPYPIQSVVFQTTDSGMRTNS